MQDGPGYFLETSYALDNLVGGGANASRRLPVFVPVSIENGGCDAIGSERGLEYDTLSDRYARFVEDEVLPAVLADPAVRAAFPGLRFSADPAQRVTFGCSSGGAAAMTMAYMRPVSVRVVGVVRWGGCVRGRVHGGHATVVRHLSGTGSRVQRRRAQEALSCAHAVVLRDADGPCA